MNPVQFSIVDSVRPMPAAKPPVAAAGGAPVEPLATAVAQSNGDGPPSTDPKGLAAPGTGGPNTGRNEKGIARAGVSAEASGRDGQEAPRLARRSIKQGADVQAQGVEDPKKTRDATATGILLAAQSPFAAIMNRLCSRQEGTGNPKPQTGGRELPTGPGKPLTRIDTSPTAWASGAKQPQKPQAKGAQEAPAAEGKSTAGTGKLGVNSPVQAGRQDAPTAKAATTEQPQGKADGKPTPVPKGKADAPVAPTTASDPKLQAVARFSEAQDAKAPESEPQSRKRTVVQRNTLTAKPLDSGIAGVDVRVNSLPADGGRPSVLADQLPPPTRSPGTAASPDAARSTAEAGAFVEDLGQLQRAPVMDQVADSLGQNALRVGQQITIRLNPPELGAVRLTLEADGKDLRGVLEVENPRALGELQREAPSLMNRLAEIGVQVRRLDIGLNERSWGDSSQSTPQGNTGNPDQGWDQGSHEAPGAPSLPAESGAVEMAASFGAEADGRLLNVMI